jgi:N-acetylglucosamine kinase-like BadF-type ATPase
MGPVRELSQFSPLVLEAAFKEGDTCALRVLRNCAGALADQIAMLCNART